MSRDLFGVTRIRPIMSASCSIKKSGASFRSFGTLPVRDLRQRRSLRSKSLSQNCAASLALAAPLVHNYDVVILGGQWVVYGSKIRFIPALVRTVSALLDRAEGGRS